jgi:hypothetical protein
MSVSSDMAPYAIMYMGPVIGFLALSSFLWINLTLDAGRRQLVRHIVRVFWGGAGAMSLVALLHGVGAFPYESFQQVYAALSGVVIGASGVAVAQRMAPDNAQGLRQAG